MLTVDGFEGPLDWLLDLARTRQIDLARLSIVALVEAFEAALAEALASPDLRPPLLGRWGDWLVMAADLALLRSRLLVPADAVEAQDARNIAERLRQRLLSRVEIGRAVDWLQDREQLGRDVFGWGGTDLSARLSAEQTVDTTGLLRACLAAVRLPPDAHGVFLVAGPPFWRVSDAAERIRRMLPLIGECGAPLVRFLPEVPLAIPDRGLRCRAAVAGTFLAGLEMAREGSIIAQQERAWAAIRVRPKPVSAEDTRLP